jgi:hypothetical protein
MLFMPLILPHDIAYIAIIIISPLRLRFIAAMLMLTRVIYGDAIISHYFHYDMPHY